MAAWYRVSLPLAVALAGAALTWSAPATAARNGAQAIEPGFGIVRPAAPRLFGRSAKPLWLAIEDERAGVTIALHGKWDEHPHSIEHEQGVITTPGWHFSRIYACHPGYCDGFARAILSGGMLPATIDIRTMSDLTAQMPRKEVARVSALVAGVPEIGNGDLIPITRGALLGYRAKVTRSEPDGSKIALVIDCLYGGSSFLILTAVTNAGKHKTGAALLDEIEAGTDFTKSRASTRH